MLRPCSVAGAEAPAVKAAPKRRRGGKHRNKGLVAEAAAEAAAEAGGEAAEGVAGGQSGAEHALSDGALPDNLARLHLDRLASNAAAGNGLLPWTLQIWLL